MAGIKRPLPGVGMRMIKSAVSVFLCLLLSLVIDREGMRMYSSIAALQCIQPYDNDTRRMALQRLTGTAVGTVFGALAILAESGLQIRGTAGSYLIIALCIIPILWSAIWLGKSNAAYFSCVVFLSIAVTHISDANPWLFVWHRASETLAGVIIGVAVNSFRLPRRPQRDVLFVSGLDGVLLNAREEMTAFSRIQLNRMLDDGALFTISTMRTPASVREAAAGLRLRLPVIVMDGAAMYDMEKRQYLCTSVLSEELAERCRTVLERCGLQVFRNRLLENVLLIYHGELKNPAERDLYERLRASPYRNYVSGPPEKDQGKMLYLMALDRAEVVERAVDALLEQGLMDQVKVISSPAPAYPGYCFLKLYDRSASRPAMLERLKEMLQVTKTVTFGSIEGQADVVTRDLDGNQVVRRLERMYERYPWDRT